MKTDVFRNVICEREACHDEWAYGIEQCWKKEIDLLSEDIPSTIEFLRTECTAEEYSWISEVLDDVIEETLSRELLECYKALMEKFPDECKTYNIASIIEICDGILEWEEEDEKKGYESR